jgi:hypothetical protein
MPTIWPQDMIELQPLRIGDASAGFPFLPTVVAKRETKPVLAITLALILEKCMWSEKLEIYSSKS